MRILSGIVTEYMDMSLELRLNLTGGHRMVRSVELVGPRQDFLVLDILKLVKCRAFIRCSSLPLMMLRRKQAWLR